MGIATFVQGDALMLDYTPGSAVTAGDVSLLGTFPCIAHRDIAANVLAARSFPNGHVVYDVTKDTSTFTAGDVVYWDAVAKKATSTSAGNNKMGIALADAATGVGTVRIVNRV